MLRHFKTPPDFGRMMVALGRDRVEYTRPPEPPAETFSSRLCTRFAREALEREAERAAEPPYNLVIHIERDQNIERLSRFCASGRLMKRVGAR